MDVRLRIPAFKDADLQWWMGVWEGRGWGAGCGGAKTPEGDSKTTDTHQVIY